MWCGCAVSGWRSNRGSCPSKINLTNALFDERNHGSSIRSTFASCMKTAGAAVFAAEQLGCCVCPHGMQRVHAADQRAAGDSEPYVDSSAAAAAQTR